MEKKNVEDMENDKNSQNPLEVDEETIESLTEGLLCYCKPHLEIVQKAMDELTEQQVILREQLSNENLKLSWTQNSVELIKILDTISVYQSKLINIKKDMKLIQENNLKLKKRVTRLQQHIEKTEYIQNQQKESELKMEQDLINH